MDRTPEQRENLRQAIAGAEAGLELASAEVSRWTDKMRLYSVRLDTLAKMLNEEN